MPTCSRRSALHWAITVVLAGCILLEGMALLDSGPPTLAPATNPVESPSSAAAMPQLSSVAEMPLQSLPSTTTAPIVRQHQVAVHSDQRIFQRTFGTNPHHCNVQPNVTDIDPYKGCPLPGLNNLLFTQVNRWYCAVRDNRVLHLRDRSCNKGSDEPFRFSTIIQIDYDALVRVLPGRPNAAICWSDIARQDKAPHCEWGDIPKSYGSELWWKARQLVDFHPTYYTAARHFVRIAFDGQPYLAVHLRRGDYWQHCVVIKRRAVPPWISFKDTKKRFDFERGCYPPIALVEETLKSVAAEYGLRHIFIATNTPDEFAGTVSRLAPAVNVVVAMPSSFFQSIDVGPGAQKLRKLDALIVEVAVLALGDAFLFNRYSSLSGIAYEMAVMHGKLHTGNDERVSCW